MTIIQLFPRMFRQDLIQSLCNDRYESMKKLRANRIGFQIDVLIGATFAVGLLAGWVQFRVLDQQQSSGGNWSVEQQVVEQQVDDQPPVQHVADAGDSATGSPADVPSKEFDRQPVQGETPSYDNQNPGHQMPSTNLKPAHSTRQPPAKAVSKAISEDAIAAEHDRNADEFEIELIAPDMP